MNTHVMNRLDLDREGTGDCRVSLAAEFDARFGQYRQYATWTATARLAVCCRDILAHRSGTLLVRRGDLMLAQPARPSHLLDERLMRSCFAPRVPHSTVLLSPADVDDLEG